MKTNLIALCAIAGLCACLKAADNSTAINTISDVPLAVFYSFDTPPPANVVGSMQSELDRILQPSNLRVVWRAIAAPVVPEAYHDIVVLRFHGSCAYGDTVNFEEQDPDAPGHPLAGTDLVDGRVLPFGNVQCDELRRYLAPVAARLTFAKRNLTLGRAIARVGAHEIYHMLTRSGAHSRNGIARAEHSRAELTAGSFGFAKPEQEWLRAWVDNQPLPRDAAKETPATPANSSGGEFISFEKP